MSNRSAFIAIVGRPNVGKSTLLNALVGEKVTIVSDKPQTTRHRINGILTKGNRQYVFVDTPGMHKGRDLLNKRIDRLAVASLKDVDVILFVVDDIMKRAESHVIDHFRSVDVPVYLVINKIDRLKKRTEIDRIILSYLDSFEFAGVIPLSAQEHTHLDRLFELIDPHLSVGPLFYPEETKSDQSEERFMAELIREKILFYTEQEVPHAVAVVIESLAVDEERKQLDVSALIVVERKTQKGILIGKDGARLKRIGTEARREINRLLDRRIHLDLWVKVKKDWRNRPSDLRAFGYDE
ncbi:MAG: GTPase Era [Acholeplasmataceae bacterium]